MDFFRKKTFYFGKVAHYSARKINLVEITLETRDCRTWGGSVAICGGFWDGKKTDYVECGQCLDSIAKYRRHFTAKNKALFDKLFHLWKNCHLKKWDNITTADQNEILELLKDE